MIDLQSIFSDPAPAGPSPEPAAAAPVPSPAPAVTTVPTAQPQAADHLDHDAQPDALDLDADGWPVGAFEPQDCPTCPGLLTWQDVGGRWRCETCDADALARAQRLADGAARSRERWPAKPTPQDAPGRDPTPPADSQHPGSRRPSERAPGAFRGCEKR